MADFLVVRGVGSVEPSMVERWRDMGDGTHALVRSVVLSAGTITSLIPGTGATNLGKAEDALHASGDVGVFLLAVRNDANAQLTTTDLAYSALTTDDYVRLKVIVSSKGVSIDQSPTVTAGAYAADDAVGGLLTFVGAAGITGEGGVIKDVLIIDDTGDAVEMELWLFRETFTAMVDNAPWAPSEADLRKVVAIISTADGAWFNAGTAEEARIEVSQRYDCVGTSLFGQLVTRAIMTPGHTDDYTVTIGLLQD